MIAERIREAGSRLARNITYRDKSLMTEATKRLVKVKVDVSRCGGHARCMEEAPQIFGYDSKTNKAYILEGADVEAHRAGVSIAIRACPEFALSWDDDAQAKDQWEPECK